MIREVILDTRHTESRTQSNQLGFPLQQAQDVIYQFLLDTVKQQPPETVLQEFKLLFIDYNASEGNPEAIQALSEILFANDEKEFINTLKRSCYIVINNWYTSRNFTASQDLVSLFSDVKLTRKTLSPTLSRQRAWLLNFINSQDYHELQLFITQQVTSDPGHWSNRYISYLLVPQYTNLNNPVEQREAARILSKKLKDQFKFDLAMYTAHSKSAICREPIYNNPTGLGDKVVDLIKKIVVKHGMFNYKNVANIFLEQTKDSNYKRFKKSLHNYLIFSVKKKELVKSLNQTLTEKLNDLYKDYHDTTIEAALLLRTCNRLIEYLTTENQDEPSPLFILLMSQGHHLTLAMLLLKIIMICPNSRNHLETCIAKLIQYYTNYAEEDCRWVITFFEVFKITFAIHTENVQYNLIKMDNAASSEFQLDAYRVFSQLRDYVNLEEKPENQ
ncbi:hypothetical protein MC7420_6526 [Coleofasciculus chthonoplastes PCC 7420]|uniref:Uncharacterized protein n=1 Tax=Coleofasciculus chthonoplastes PCC 7420 TaxID=118168 RepID=B4VQG2_9CYAN|nr:hypothetical protein [Coleofasciculus chthonoplastes]EDX75871.1 hypothetical protein MC7420_6526 [Coleofasciculus chthonoplastes PCC 7420]